MYNSKIIEAADIQIKEPVTRDLFDGYANKREIVSGNGHAREFRPVITLTKCISCGGAAMHHSRFGVDCGDDACVEKISAVVEKLQQDLQMEMREHANDKKYLEDKISMLEDSLDVWRRLAKKRRNLIRRIKFMYYHAKGIYPEFRLRKRGGQ